MPAASDDFGKANLMSTAFSSIAPEGPSTGVFDYDETAEDDDESGYRFGAHAFRPGEYVSIRNEEGDMHTFQVATVEPTA